MTTTTTPDLDLIYRDTVAGIVDNARANGVAIGDGWDAEAAIDLYNPEIAGLTFDGADWSRLIARVEAFLARHAGHVAGWDA